MGNQRVSNVSVKVYLICWTSHSASLIDNNIYNIMQHLYHASPAQTDPSVRITKLHKNNKTMMNIHGRICSIVLCISTCEHFEFYFPPNFGWVWIFSWLFIQWQPVWIELTWQPLILGITLWNFTGFIKESSVTNKNVKICQNEIFALNWNWKEKVKCKV